jgi:hypothetical protein
MIKQRSYFKANTHALNAIKAALSIYAINWRGQRKECATSRQTVPSTRRSRFSDEYQGSSLFPKAPVAKGNFISLEDRLNFSSTDMYKRVGYWTELKINLRKLTKHRL